jgi:hypothetical protein
MNRIASASLLGMILLAFHPVLAAEKSRKIPLADVFTSTGQKNTKDLWKEFKDGAPKFIDDMTDSKPYILLVNGKDLPSAIQASNPGAQRCPKTGAPIDLKSNEQIWVGALLGANGSSPPAYQVLSVEVEGTKVKITYEHLESFERTADFHLYLAWAPLGKLEPGEYTVELYDAVAKKVTASSKRSVVVEK